MPRPLSLGRLGTRESLPKTVRDLCAVLAMGLSLPHSGGWPTLPHWSATPPSGGFLLHYGSGKNTPSLISSCCKSPTCKFRGDTPSAMDIAEAVPIAWPITTAGPMTREDACA